MSIDQFTKAMKTAAGEAVANKLLADLVDSSVARFRQGNISKAASILTQGDIKSSSGATVPLSKAFRAKGEAQGRTRFIITDKFLNQLFSIFNISHKDAPIEIYLDFLKNTSGSKYKAKHFEFYSDDGNVTEYTKQSKTTVSQAIESLNKSKTIAVRGLNFSHANTVKHIAYFLKYLDPVRFASIDTTEKALTQVFDRGHVYAQTTGRALASLPKASGILGEIVKLSEFLDEETSGLKEDKYRQILARAKKDFTSKSLYMNIELQLIDDNRDAGGISAVLRIVGLLQGLIDNVTLSKDGSRLLSTPKAASLKTFAKSLEAFSKKLNNSKTKSDQDLKKIVSQSSNPNFLLNLQTSDSLLKFVGDVIVEAVTTGKATKKLKTNTGTQLVKKVPGAGKAPNINTADIRKEALLIKKQVDDVVRMLNKNTQAPKLKNLKGQFTSPTALQILINKSLYERIKANMGTGTSTSVLNFRTGRFARSAKVENISVSREGMVTAFYSYMKYPYQTFEPGFKQGRPASRDPKLLISKSIREIATTIVGNRLRSVRL